MPNARFNSMFGIREVLNRDFMGKRGIKSRNKDRVIVIVGYEGTGKSNLALNLFEEWRKIIGKPVTEEDIKYIASNKKEFVTGLKACEKYDMIIHDEAGKDLYARNSISSFNKDLNIAYQVIRGKNLFTVLVIPHVLDLDPFFRRRRVTAMLHVYKEGRFAYYSKERLRYLLPGLMKFALYSADPDPFRVRDSNGEIIKPNFYDSFPLYKGVLKEQYEARKTQNMQQVVDELLDKYGEESEESPKEKKKRELNFLRQGQDSLYDLFKKKYQAGDTIKEIRKELLISPKMMTELRARYVIEMNTVSSGDSS